MSNSAFTPSTTTVTNEVPVNVPVVQVFRQYSAIAGTDITATTTNPTFGVVTLNNVNIFRSGEEARFYFTFSQSSGGSAGSGTYRFIMPSGITIDTSKTGTNTSSDFFGKSVVGRAYASLPSGSELDTQLFVVNSTTIECRSFGSNTVANFGGALRCTFEFNVPIAEWAGSGTTTLATRAVEEYAWNSDTSNASNTSAFGYGPDGVNFLSTTPATAAISKRVRFQTSIQPTDSIIFEVNTNGLWRQLSAEAATIAGQQIYNYITHYNNAYGAGRILQVNSTDVDVSFAKYASTGTTYDAASGGAWGSITAGTAKWRLRKVSSGAQVGYPVSARNIVGDTSGSVVPTGMLGEQVLFTTRSVSAVTPNWVANTSPLITLTPGTWILFPQITGIAAAGLTSVLAFLSTDSNSNSTGNLSLENGAFVLAANATINQSDIPMAMIYLNVTQNTPIYAKARTSGANTTITLKGRAIRIA